MRRPALYRRPAPATGWSHPYTGPFARAVLYNDGGDPPVPPAPSGEPPKPGPPKAYSQEDLNRIAAEEKAQGKRAGAREAVEKLAADLGFTKPEDIKAFVEAGRKAQEEAMSDLEKREKAIADREAKAAEEQAAAAQVSLAARRTMVLVRLGATSATPGTDEVDNLADAEALLRAAVPGEADDAALTAAATALKKRRPELFGTPAAPPAPGTPPPAPGGAPAGGPPPRQTPAGKPGDRGREMARLRGHIKADR